MNKLGRLVQELKALCELRDSFLDLHLVQLQLVLLVLGATASTRRVGGRGGSSNGVVKRSGDGFGGEGDGGAV